MGYIKNSWNILKLVCGNHGEDHSIALQIQSGPHSLFYACPKYHAENRSAGEHPCFNRLTLKDYEKILSHISDLMMGDEVLCLDNYKWKTKNGIECKVLSCTAEEIVIEVVNRPALNGQKI